MYYSHIFNLKMSEWVSVEGRIEEVLSNSVPTSNWYQSRALGAKRPKVEIPQVDS